MARIRRPAKTRSPPANRISSRPRPSRLPVRPHGGRRERRAPCPRPGVVLPGEPPATRSSACSRRPIDRRPAKSARAAARRRCLGPRRSPASPPPGGPVGWPVPRAVRGSRGARSLLRPGLWATRRAPRPAERCRERHDRHRKTARGLPPAPPMAARRGRRIGGRSGRHAWAQPARIRDLDSRKPTEMSPFLRITGFRRTGFNLWRDRNRSEKRR